MKKLRHIALLCCIGMSSLGQAQTAQVYIAGSNFPVKFSDTNLSAKTKQRIAADLTIVFSFAPPFEELKGQELETGVFQLKDCTMLFCEESEHIFVVDHGNKKGIRLDKPLSDKYLKAFTWMDTNSNTVKKVHELVALLNSPDLLSKPIQILRKMNHFVPLSLIDENNPPNEAEIRGMFAKDFFPYKYLEVSALNFYFKEISEIGNAELPLLLLFATDKTDPSGIDAFPIGFYKGKWGFGSFPSP